MAKQNLMLPLTELYLKNLWRWVNGMVEVNTDSLPSYESIERNKWDIKFIMLMKNRLIQGVFRYGLFGKEGLTYKQNVEHLCSFIRQRLLFFEKKKDLDFLVDVANGAMMLYIIMKIFKRGVFEKTNPHEYKIGNPVKRRNPSVAKKCLR